ncbi:biotin transporter BioY [Thermosipho atlanticus]|uniref:Biotin transporter n=1 Tax=Thermosipho atlanticus DSM 15807 TaxID=1123380 RepID=A0A1M5R851_9BACT|nr:biotin transporter BioY [Thermosipho atlanticus]SHH22249.1 biotin transport system substrate-specific component [Thermosipho atlanticus DSM 15807]
MRSNNITRISLFVALTIVGAQISIPIGSVPITLQVLMVFLTGYLLTPKMAFLAQLVYLLMGIIGLPVFSNFSGGIAHILGPTGGYLLAFPLAAMIVAFSKNSLSSKILFGILGLSTIYLFGVLVLSFYLKSFSKALMVGVIPFIWIDLLKLTTGILVSEKLYMLEVKQ